jgi:hypothetical protein
LLFFSDVASEDRAPTVLRGSDTIFLGLEIGSKSQSQSGTMDELIGNGKHAILDISEWCREAFLCGSKCRLQN